MRIFSKLSEFASRRTASGLECGLNMKDILDVPCWVASECEFSE